MHIIKRVHKAMGASQFSRAAFKRMMLAICFETFALLLAGLNVLHPGFILASYISGAIGFVVFASGAHLQQREIAYQDWKANHENCDQD